MKLKQTIFFILLVVIAVLLVPSTVGAHGPTDGGASTSDINELFTIIFFLSIPVFILVEGLIIYAVVQSIRRRRESEPDQIEGDLRLEITWTVLSFVIIAVIFALTYRFMTTEYEAEAQNETGTPDYTIHVEGYQYNWNFEYFRGEGEPLDVRTTRTLHLPTDRLILLEITSTDVQHSFWLPELAGKVDAIPGYVNTMWLQIDEPGTYKGNCAEYCGDLHFDMIIILEAQEPAAFEEWLAQQRAETGEPIGPDLDSPLPEGDPVRGQTVFDETYNCNSCHGAQAGVGPSLSHLRDHADEHEGYTPEEYLRESILLPCEYETEGYNCGVMPDDYGERMDAQQLADIIAYLRDQ